VLDDLFSTNIVWMIKSRTMRWAGHVACMGERRSKMFVMHGIQNLQFGKYKGLVGKPVGKRPF
jgi:hypothetical protein